MSRDGFCHHDEGWKARNSIVGHDALSLFPLAAAYVLHPYSPVARQMDDPKSPRKRTNLRCQPSSSSGRGDKERRICKAPVLTNDPLEQAVAPQTPRIMGHVVCLKPFLGASLLTASLGERIPIVGLG